MNSPAASLSRSMGLVRSTAMVVGTIIGASIFVQPSLVTEQVPGVGGIFAVWLVAGALTLAGALVCAELASAYPRAGGVYEFLRAAFGPGAGFLWGWAMFWSVHTGIAAAIAMVFARYAAQLIPLDGTGQRLAAIGALLAVSAANYAGVRQASGIQTVLTIIKVAAVAGLAALLFALGGGAGEAAAAAAPVDGELFAGLSVHTLLLGLVAGLFAFGGWHMVAYTAEETRDPERTLPRALLFGTLIVTACYLALNAAYLHVLGVEAVTRSSAVAADAATRVMGRGGAALTSLLVVVSTLGALAGVVLSGPRLYWAMARDGMLPGALAEVHARYHTPHRAVVLQAVWATVLIATGSYRALFTRVVYTEWLFFGAMAIGLLLLRRRPGYNPAYRVPGGPVLPAAFAAATLLIVANQVVSEPASSAVGLGLVLAGLPFHMAWQRRAASERTPK